MARPESLPGVDKEKLYYKLVPVRSASTIYTPVDTSVFMRPVMTKEAADHLIDRIPEISEDSFECRDPRMLAEHYRTSLQTHECEDLIRLIKTVLPEEQKAGPKRKETGQNGSTISETCGRIATRRAVRRIGNLV